MYLEKVHVIEIILYDTTTADQLLFVEEQELYIELPLNVWMSKFLTLSLQEIQRGSSFSTDCIQDFSSVMICTSWV